jgi:adenosine kinase
MILVSGSLAYDVIFDFPGKFKDHIIPDKLHYLNVSFLVHKMRRSYGGTAGNIAYNLALLGIETAIIGLVGKDFSEYLAFLNSFKIDTSNIKVIDSMYTSNAFGITDSSDNQIWGFYTGADGISENLSISDVHGPVDFAVIAPHNPKTMLKFAKEYTKKKVPYMFDPGMQLPWLSREDLLCGFKGAKIIIGNDYEISVMEKKSGIKNLHNLTKNKDIIVITTMGEKGCLVSVKGVQLEVGAIKVDYPTDPAGAGDAFRGGFLAGFMRKFPIEKSARMGCVCASYTVEAYGTTTHVFSYSDFCRRYEKRYNEKLTL